MALNQKVAKRLINELHKANKDYFVKNLNLTDEESEFLFHAWKLYIKEHPEVLKRSPLGSLDSFISGYLAHAEFTRKKNGFSRLPEVPAPSAAHK